MKYRVRRKPFLFALLLIVIGLLVAGCGAPTEAVDVFKDPPQGLWQTVAVWPLAQALVWLNDQLLALNVPYHWGFAIIVFTLIVKIVTLPLSIKQIQGMQAQKAMQPKIQEIQKKYGKDREKLMQEQMKIYKEAGINPLSGCLPLLIQMPVLIGLYSALVTIGPLLEGASWFWIPDLAFPSYVNGISWLGEAFSEGNYGLILSYLILPVLLVVSQLWMQKNMTPPSSDPQMQSMQQVSSIMTIMFGYITLQTPAGLSLYWVTSNLLQMLQTWAFNQFGLSATTPASSDTTSESVGSNKSASESTSNKPASDKAAGFSSNGTSTTSQPSGQKNKANNTAKSKRK